mgnify:CR=1 FL=1
MTHDVVLVLDCGATNVRAIAVDSRGNRLAQAAVANASAPGAENPPSFHSCRNFMRPRRAPFVSTAPLSIRYRRRKSDAMWA